MTCRPIAILVLLLLVLFTACQSRPVEPLAIPTPLPAGMPTQPPGPTPLPATHSSADPTTAPHTAAIAEAVNAVDARQAAEAKWDAAAIGQILPTGGEVLTHADSQARVDFTTGAIVRLGPETHFTVAELSGPAADTVTRLTLVAGEVWAILTASLNDGSFEIETPVGSASVRGSYLSVAFDPVTQSLIASCLEGNCRVRNALGQIDLIAGQETSIFGLNQRPDLPRPLAPERLERWRQFVREAEVLIEPMRLQLEPVWSATRAALQTQIATFTPQPGLLLTLAASRTPPPLRLTLQPGGIRP